MKNAKLFSVALAISFLALANRADAQGLSAADHARRAQVNYDLQNWSLAIQEFHSAYAIEQKTDYLWGLAQAHRLAGDCAAAIKTFKAYRRSDLTANQSTAAELQITKCEAEIEKKEAEAAVEARKAAEAQPAAVVAPRVAAPPPGATDRPAPAAALEKKHFYLDVFGDTLFVGGAAAAGVGIYFLLRGSSDMVASTSNPTYRQYDSAVDHASAEQTTGGVLLGVGGALIAGSIVRWLTMGSGSTEARAALVVAPNGVAGRF